MHTFTIFFLILLQQLHYKSVCLFFVKRIAEINFGTVNQHQHEIIFIMY